MKRGGREEKGDPISLPHRNRCRKKKSGHHGHIDEAKVRCHLVAETKKKKEKKPQHKPKKKKKKKKNKTPRQKKKKKKTKGKRQPRRCAALGGGKIKGRLRFVER